MPNNSTPPSSSQSALADATAGAVGSLVSMLCFYPIDIIKTNLQAGRNDVVVCDSVDGLTSTTKEKERTLMILSRWIKLVTRGLHCKMAHTLTSSFTYFFIASWIQSRHELLVTSGARKRHHGGSGGGASDYRPSTVTRLCLSAVAAMMNTFLTLPLDVISTRMQTRKLVTATTTTSRERQCVATMVSSDAEGSEYFEEEKKAEESSSTLAVSHCDNEDDGKHVRKGASPTTPPPHTIPPIVTSPPPPSMTSFASLWNGLGPALLLCSNPAINFTAFDTIKLHVLRRKARMDDSSRLSMREAFTIGLFAKFVATMVTYPLIRVKVLLMVASNNDENEGDHPNDGKHRTLIGTLRRIMKEEGMRGYYKGCHLQLLHTVLKSALLMMIREKISVFTRRMILAKTLE